MHENASLCSGIDRRRVRETENGSTLTRSAEIRRSQIVLASARKETARRIARTLSCDDQTVRNVIKKFNAIGWMF